MARAPRTPRAGRVGDTQATSDYTREKLRPTGPMLKAANSKRGTQAALEAFCAGHTQQETFKTGELQPLRDTD